MKRLRDFQAAVIASAPDTMATCRVVAVQGEDALLQPDRPQLTAGVCEWTPATLSFDSAGGPVLLAGYVEPGRLPETIRFAQGDGVRMPQMRASARLVLALPVRMRRIVTRGGGRGLDLRATTVDISAGGMLVAGYDAPPAGTGVEVQLALPGHGGALMLHATVLGPRGPNTALRFDEQAETISDFVLGCRQEVAKLAARRAAETARKLSGESLRAA